jgi:phosphoribosylformimino-5-aminoimidazole carboxamide ribotide isomerase
MLIIPGLYIYKGKTVSFYKGYDNEEKTVYYESPLKIAKQFKNAGAANLHIVDLDGSFANTPKNQKIILDIVRQLKLIVQVAGGIRTIEDIENYLDNGVDKVILGYGAMNIVKNALTKYGKDRIYAGIKAKKNIIDTDEVLEKALEVNHAAKQFEKLGITNIIYKDLEKEGTFHPNFDEVDRLLIAVKSKIHVSGGIGKINDIKIMKRIKVEALIICRAFLEGKLRFKECLNIAK